MTGVHLQPDRCISCSVPYHSGSCSCIQSQLSEQGQWRTKRSLLQIPSMAFSEHCDPGLNPGWLLCRLHTSLFTEDKINQTTREPHEGSQRMTCAAWSSKSKTIPTTNYRFLSVHCQKINKPFFYGCPY